MTLECEWCHKEWSYSHRVPLKGVLPKFCSKSHRQRSYEAHREEEYRMAITWLIAQTEGVGNDHVFYVSNQGERKIVQIPDSVWETISRVMDHREKVRDKVMAEQQAAYMRNAGH